MARIFISYRRQDSAYPAGILRDALQARFGTDSVFFDLDNIPFGVDFRQYIGNAVGQCDVLLVMIGDQWLQLTDDQGRRRIEDLCDYVRIEIESALKRDIPVVPVLVEEAKMPGASELPESIRDLAYRNAAEIGRGRDQKHQIERLVSDLERIWPARVSDTEKEKPAAPEEEKPSTPEPRKTIARPKVRGPAKPKPQVTESAPSKAELDRRAAFLEEVRRSSSKDEEVAVMTSEERFKCAAVKRWSFWAHIQCWFRVTTAGLEFVDEQKPKYSFIIPKNRLRGAVFTKKGMKPHEDLVIVLTDGSKYEIGFDTGNREKALAAINGILSA